MARRGGPALYELLGNKRDPSQGSGRGGGPILDARQRSLFVLALVAVVALLVGYMIGVARGERIGRDRVSAERAEDARLLAQARPSMDGRPAGASGNASPSPEAPQAADAAEQGPAAAKATAGIELPAAQPGVDPREAGKNYFVIMNTRAAAAEQVVGFCRKHGLDAWAVGDQNAPFRDIIVLPGFDYEDRRSPTVVELEAAIKRVGLLWKTEARTDKGFEGAYPRLFKGG